MIVNLKRGSQKHSSGCPFSAYFIKYLLTRSVYPSAGHDCTSSRIEQSDRC